MQQRAATLEQRHQVRTRLHMIEISVNYQGRTGSSKITAILTGILNTGLKMLGLILSRRLKVRSLPGLVPPQALLYRLKGMA